MLSYSRKSFSTKLTTAPLIVLLGSLVVGYTVKTREDCNDLKVSCNNCGPIGADSATNAAGKIPEEGDFPNNGQLIRSDLNSNDYISVNPRQTATNTISNSDISRMFDCVATFCDNGDGTIGGHATRCVDSRVVVPTNNDNCKLNLGVCSHPEGPGLVKDGTVDTFERW